MIAVTFALPVESRDFVAPADVVVAHTGVGERSARRRTEELLRGERYAAVVSSGFAGALTDKLEVGSVFAAANFSDAALLEKVSLPRAQLTTVSAVAESIDERRQLAQRTGAAAVDMETQWIRAACDAAGVPLLCVRAISDSPAAPLPVRADVLFDVERQRTSASRLGAYLLQHPRAILRLLRFSRQIASTRANLTAALHAVLRDIR